MINILLLLHLLGVIVWVGGMFFAHMALRPAVAEQLQPPPRLSLLNAVFRRFFPWVWLSVILILSSGSYWMILLGGFKAGWHIHAMLAIGLAMMAIFSYIYFVPFVRLKQEVTSQDWPAAGQSMARIRRLVGVNLILGLANTVVALMGRLLIMGS
jgi:uncharacterized membrane protein